MFITLLVLLGAIALFYPDEATKGMTLATRGGYNFGRSAGRLLGPVMPGKATPKTPAKKTASKGRTGSTVRKPAKVPASFREAVGGGWAAGVQHGLDKRAAGKDVGSRARRVVGWTAKLGGKVVGPAITRRRERKAERAVKAAALVKARQNQTIDPALRAPGRPAAVADPPSPSPDRPNPYVTEKEATDSDQKTPDTKENNMAAVTDLINVGMGIKEGQDGQRAATAVLELWNELKMRASSASERYAGVGWGTPRIDAAGEALADAQTVEAVLIAYTEFEAACTEAKNAAEPLSAVKGYGDARAFQDA